MGRVSFKTRRLVGAMSAVVCSGVLGLEAMASGYLPSTGPVPLRFESEKPPVKPLVLPALVMEEPPPAPSAEVTPPEAAPASETVTGQAAPETNAPPAVTTAEVATVAPAADSAAALLDQLYGNHAANPFAIPAPQPAPEPGAEAPASNVLVVTPQMLVEYFKANPAAGTPSNGTNAAVFTPIGFMPPAPVGLPSSQATYRTP